jgi:hypothetical protein
MQIENNNNTSLIITTTTKIRRRSKKKTTIPFTKLLNLLFYQNEMREYMCVSIAIIFTN